MHCELSVDIPAPPELVWELAQNPATRHLWDVRVSRYEIDQHQRAGSQVRMTVRMGPLRPQATGTMLRWEPPYQSIVHIKEATSPLLPVGAGSWTFKPTENGTRYTTRFTLKADTLPWWMSKSVLMKFVQWDTYRSLKRLKRLVLKEMERRKSA